MTSMMDLDASVPPWAVYPHVIDRLQCEQIIKRYGKNLKPAIATAENEERVAEGRFFRSQMAADIFYPLFKRYGRLRLPVTYNDFEDLHIVKYGSGGKYDWHADNELVPTDNRKLTAVLALNDGFEGGGLDFMWPNPGTVHHVDLNPGDVCIFPSIMFHRGVEVTSGERWIIVSWATGKQFK